MTLRFGINGFGRVGRMVFRAAVPGALKWGDVNAEVVFESTGLFSTKDTCRKHLDAGSAR
jgi:glyceraldehyde-3-phosphate dehydrogenase/erythrose-4-phosphate dehydrogenase